MFQKNLRFLEVPYKLDTANKPVHQKIMQEIPENILDTCTVYPKGINTKYAVFFFCIHAAKVYIFLT